MDAKQVIRGEDGAMRCRDCGFGYALAPAELVERTGQGVEAVEHAVAGVDGHTPCWSRSRRVGRLSELTRHSQRRNRTRNCRPGRVSI
jgi:hypothetical protein